MGADTVPNETDATRGSIDFRVVPRALYCERYSQSHRSDGMPRFAPGGFFAVMDLRDGSSRRDL